MLLIRNKFWKSVIFFKILSGHILTECAAEYLEQLYLCKHNDLLKYYLNIPQAMDWFKEILDGSWFYASDRCTIEYVRSPNTQGK